MKEVAIIGLALMLDFIIGDPQSVPHPIRYIGKWISFLEKIIRDRFSNLKLGGFALLLGSIAMTLIVVKLAIWSVGLLHPLLSDAVKLYIIYSALAAKCLDVESRKVYRELVAGKLAEARKKIGYLVGRDTSELESDEITRATVETVAENTVDGILAPLFYIGVGLFFGIPAELVYIYKTVNTLDSMVGYNNEKYGDIGFASAKLDDVLNYIPARIGSCFMAVSGLILGYNFKNSVKIINRDRRNHKSPNCGYPESAVAGLIGIQLGGTNVYFGESVYKPTIGDRLREIEPDDIIKTIKVMYLSEILFATGILLLYIIGLR